MKLMYRITLWVALVALMLPAASEAQEATQSVQKVNGTTEDFRFPLPKIVYWVAVARNIWEDGNTNIILHMENEIGGTYRRSLKFIPNGEESYVPIGKHKSYNFHYRLLRTETPDHNALAEAGTLIIFFALYNHNLIDRWLNWEFEEDSNAAEPGYSVRDIEYKFFSPVLAGKANASIEPASWGHIKATFAH